MIQVKATSIWITIAKQQVHLMMNAATSIQLVLLTISAYTAERDRSFVKCCNRGAYTNIPTHKGLPSLLFNLFMSSYPRSRDFPNQ